MLDPTQDLGASWAAEMAAEIIDNIPHVTPVDFNEATRYLPNSVSDIPGPFSFSLTPYMRELVNNCDQRVNVQETNLMKGVQIGYTTMLECVLLYYVAHVKTRPCMLISADRELVKGRIENCILPMLEQSGLSDLIRSSDEGNSRKTGKTANHLQWEGGGFLIPGGANNADKMRMWSILLMLKDEVDAWADVVGKDGDPDKLTDARTDTFPHTKKIYRGGTPLIKGSSKIERRFAEGDQRLYFVPCKHCGHMQPLKWQRINQETGQVSGFVWDLDDDGLLLTDTVRYLCESCGGAHYEHDKPVLFAAENGAEWRPTAKPARRGVRSYKLPAFYSPYGFRPWHQCVSEYLEAFDPVARKVLSIGKYQVFYNNVLGEPFELLGAKLKFETVSAHRRTSYLLGEVPNRYAAQHSGSRILFLTCSVDVHKSNLAVSVFGWTAGKRCYLVDYWRFETDGDCAELSEKPWQDLREVIDEKIYTADDGSQYRVAMTLVDSGYNNATVVEFCSAYAAGVYPILGRDRPAKAATLKEFSEFTTQAGTVGYKIVVDHYKDQMSTYLRREWQEGDVFGVQKKGHFNAPINLLDKPLKELTVESRRKKTDPNGVVSYYWHRPQSVDNELWDLLGYGFAAVDMTAHSLCIQYFEQEAVDWGEFWEFAAMPEHNELFARLSFDALD